MKSIICDRCGKPINYFPGQQSIKPSFIIKRFAPFPYGLIDLDLCIDCTKDMDNIINDFLDNDVENESEVEGTE